MVRRNMMNLAEAMKNIKDDDPNFIKLDPKDPNLTKHYFANDSYVREMCVPAGSCIVGRIHKQECINILLEGDITIIDEYGAKTELSAPHVFIAPAGNQKTAYCKTAVRWMNTFATNETDMDKILDMFTCETIEEYEEYKRGLV